MGKKIKGQKLKEGQSPKTVLYEVNKDTQVEFWEKDTNDLVIINFQIEDSQYSLYSEEYLPHTVGKEGNKKADITALIVDEGKNKLKYYLADVKSNIQGEDMIFKLCDQWVSGLKYLKHTILFNIEDMDEEEHILVITRKFDEDKICRMIAKREEHINNVNVNQDKGIIAVKMMMNADVKVKKEYELLKRFVNKEFIYKDKEVKDEIHKFEVCKLEHDVSVNKYKYALNVAI